MGNRVSHTALARDIHAALQHRLRVVVHLVPFDVGDLAFQVQLAHEIRFAVVQVDRLGIDQFRGADRIDVGNHFVTRWPAERLRCVRWSTVVLCIPLHSASLICLERCPAPTSLSRVVAIRMRRADTMLNVLSLMCRRLIRWAGFWPPAK